MSYSFFAESPCILAPLCPWPCCTPHSLSPAVPSEIWNLSWAEGMGDRKIGSLKPRVGETRQIGGCYCLFGSAGTQAMQVYELLMISVGLDTVGVTHYATSVSVILTNCIFTSWWSRLRLGQVQSSIGLWNENKTWSHFSENSENCFWTWPSGQGYNSSFDIVPPVACAWDQSVTDGPGRALSAAEEGKELNTSLWASPGTQDMRHFWC